MRRRCKKCGKFFSLLNIAYERRGQGKFCSRKCSVRRLPINERYFDYIKTAQQAYWLGMLCADGTVNKSNTTLALKLEDRYHVERFRAALKSQHKISITTSGYGSKMARVSISSEHLSAALQRYGCKQAKSFVLRYPRIDRKLDKHFIRGLFDGDGCICLAKLTRVRRKYWHWSLYSASPSMLRQLKWHLNHAGIHATKSGREIRICNKTDLKKLASFLYVGAKVFLIRKKRLFDCASASGFKSIKF